MRQIRTEDLKFRMATNEEGERLRDLLTATGYEFHIDLDWSRVYPFWLVAEAHGEIVACVQVVPALPVGVMEHLGVDPTLSKMSRGVVVRKITDAGMATLRMAGCDMAASMIPFHLNSYKRVAKRRGWQTVATGNLLMKRT